MTREFVLFARGPSGVGLLVLLGLSFGVSLFAVRKGRVRRSVWLVFAALAALSLIVAVTLIREVPGFHPSSLWRWSADGWTRISGNPLADRQIILNAALFVPAGVTWTLLWRRPVATATCLVALSFVIECVQAATGVGAPDIADLIANSAGGVAGALLAWAALGFAAAWKGRRPTLTTVATNVAIAVVTVSGAAFALHVGADRRQRLLTEDLRRRFDHSSLEQYRQWEAHNESAHQVFGATSVNADGTEDNRDSVRVRYPASYFGLARCVFVVWTPGRAEILRTSGHECTAFIG